MRANKISARDHTTARNDERLFDGVGGTITGWPMEKLDLLEILNRAQRGVTRGGAVSGAARATAGPPGGSRGQRRDIALSDGSRISFASIEQDYVFRDDPAGHGTEI
jgi:hypothetical protein